MQLFKVRLESVVKEQSWIIGKISYFLKLESNVVRYWFLDKCMLDYDSDKVS